jgi:hypothetical protein
MKKQQGKIYPQHPGKEKVLYYLKFIASDFMMQ